MLVIFSSFPPTVLVGCYSAAFILGNAFLGNVITKISAISKPPRYRLTISVLKFPSTLSSEHSEIQAMT